MQSDKYRTLKFWAMWILDSASPFLLLEVIDIKKKIYPKLQLNMDKDRCCSCCQKCGDKIYDLRVPNGSENFTTTISLCRKCLCMMLKGGIKIYNETKE